MTMLTLTPGTLFAGRYRIVRCIAQGGMGAVYEVIHLETERRRALKVMLPDMLQSQEMRDRFRQEARVTANIESEFLVDVFDAGIDDVTRMPFLVMEMLRGEELHKRLKRVGRFSPAEVVTFLHQAALALDKTHRASIVHRDLKPGNLFITERDDGSPRIKVLDFGIAKLVAEGATSAEATRNLGTPIYMSPEQFHIGNKISPVSDIYALGMIAYTLLVGVPYWAEEMGANVFAFAAHAVLGPQESACARAARRGVPLPRAFDAWFAQITAIDPYVRFQTATSAIQALADALGIPFGHSVQRLQTLGADATFAPPSAPTPGPRSDAVGVWAHDPRNQQPAASHAFAPVSSPGFTPPSQVPHPTPPPQALPPAPLPGAMRQSQPSFGLISVGPSTPSAGVTPAISGPGFAASPPGGLGGSTPISSPIVTPMGSPMIQSGAPTTSTGVITGVPGQQQRPTPLMFAGVVAAAVSVVALLGFLLFRKSEPPASAEAPPPVSSSVVLAPAAPSAVVAPPRELGSLDEVAETESSAPSPSAKSTAPVAKASPAPTASASASSKPSKSKPSGTGQKRPAIYTPD